MSGINPGLLRNRWSITFWGALLAVLFLSLLPVSPEMPTTGWDKTNHLFAFAILVILGRQSYPGKGLAVFLGLILYGGLIEILQLFTPDRFAEWGDLMADVAGLIIGWCIEMMFGKFFRSEEF